MGTDLSHDIETRQTDAVIFIRRNVIPIYIRDRNINIKQSNLYIINGCTVL